MENAPPRRQYSALPPPRGRVMAQIFESLAGNLSSAVSKTGRALAKMKRHGSSSSAAGDASASASTSASASASTSASASASPPASAYASDGFTDPA